MIETRVVESTEAQTYSLKKTSSLSAYCLAYFLNDLSLMSAMSVLQERTNQPRMERDGQLGSRKHHKGLGLLVFVLRRALP